MSYSSGYLTSWIFPKVSTKNIQINSNGSVSSNTRYF